MPPLGTKKKNSQDRQGNTQKLIEKAQIVLLPEAAGNFIQALPTPMPPPPPTAIINTFSLKIFALE